MHLTYCIPKPGRHSGGYQVRSGRPGPGQTRFFADKKLGGKTKARAQAEAFMLAVLPHAPKHVDRRTLITKRNTSGVPGVWLAWVEGANRMLYQHVFVTWQDKRGKTHNGSVSLNKWGVEPGLQRALARRGLPADEVPAALKKLLTLAMQPSPP